MKQTAVEWLIDQMLKQGYFDGNKPLSITNLDHLEHQAKEMEKQQIMNAYEDGDINGYKSGVVKNNSSSDISPEQYFAEIYGEQLKSRQ